MNSRQVNLAIVWAFLLSWIGILPSILRSYDIRFPSFLDSLVFLQYFGALIAALIFVYRANGKKGIKEIFLKFTIVKTNTWIILMVLFLPWLISFLSTVIGYQISEASWPEIFTTQKIAERFLMAIVLQLILNTEEFVWRGVVFDAWLKKYGYLKACAVLAIVWWAFHMPMFLRNGGHEAGQELLPFSIMVVAMTFVMGWLYKNTMGSLLYVHLFHQLLNSTSEAFPLFPIINGGTEEPYLVMITIIVLMAITMFLNETNKRKKDRIMI